MSAEAPTPKPGDIVYEQMMGTGILACGRCASLIPHNTKALEIHTNYHKLHDGLIVPVGLQMPPGLKM